jgi:Ca2+-binding EF-hand superfamily protein
LAFRAFDKDKEGYIYFGNSQDSYYMFHYFNYFLLNSIEKDEIRQVLLRGGVLSPEEIEEMIRHYDRDHDGKINFDVILIKKIL